MKPYIDEILLLESFFKESDSEKISKAPIIDRLYEKVSPDFKIMDLKFWAYFFKHLKAQSIINSPKTLLWIKENVIEIFSTTYKKYYNLKKPLDFNQVYHKLEKEALRYFTAYQIKTKNQIVTVLVL